MFPGGIEKQHRAVMVNQRLSQKCSEITKARLDKRLLKNKVEKSLNCCNHCYILGRREKGDKT